MRDKIVRNINKEPIIGVYTITNKVNNKIYVGQSIDIERRWNQHRYGKGSLILRNAIKKYGIINFEFNIVEEVNPNNKTTLEVRKELIKLEQKWLDDKKPFIRENGYNIQTSAKPNIPIKRPESYGDLISKIKIDNNHCGKSVKQYSKDGVFIKEWKSAAEIERQLGYHAENISACCLRKNKSSKGFIWRFENDIVTKTDTQNINIKIGSVKAVKQLTLNGDHIQDFTSIVEASNNTGVHYTYISKACSKKQQSAGGYKWELI